MLPRGRPARHGRTGGSGALRGLPGRRGTPPEQVWQRHAVGRGRRRGLAGPPRSPWLPGPHPWGRGTGGRHCPGTSYAGAPTPGHPARGSPLRLQGEVGQWGPWGLRATGDPGPKAAGAGAGAGGGGVVPAEPPRPSRRGQGAATAGTVESSPTSVRSRTQTRKSSAGALHVPAGAAWSAPGALRSLLLPIPKGVWVPDPARPLPGPRDTGYPEPLGMAWNWAQAGTLRWTTTGHSQGGGGWIVPVRLPQSVRGRGWGAAGTLCSQRSPYSAASRPVEDPGPLVWFWGRPLGRLTRGPGSSAGAAAGPGPRGTSETHTPPPSRGQGPVTTT